MTKIEKAINVVNGMDTLSNGEKETLLKVLTSNESWWLKLIRILKILGALAGYFLAGLGLSSCSSFIF